MSESRLQLIIQQLLMISQVMHSGDIQSTFFEFREDLNDVTFNHAFLIETTSHTISECSVICLSYPSCESFQINEDQLNCRLYWSHFLFDDNGNFSSGWKTYSTTGPCRTGYFYTRQYHYCFRYAGNYFKKEESINTCLLRNDTLIKVNTAEENLFVSSLIYSFTNNTADPTPEIRCSNQLIIDGKKSPDGTWRSLFGANEILNFTYFEDENGTFGAGKDRLVMLPNTKKELQAYRWKAAYLLIYERSVICQYYP